MNETITVTGRKAIEIAERFGLTLNKYTDPVEGAREGLTVAEAREIASEDPSLIYVQVPADLAETDAQGDGNKYKIETRTEKSNGWTDHVGDVEANSFASREDAWLAIEALRALGAEWAEAEYRVVEA